MQLLFPRCAGLDVHSKVVVACMRSESTGSLHYETRSFATTTAGLLALSTWLITHECTHVAMEATGVYWKPVWHVLEETFQLCLANAQHIKNVPGRKSDVKDAQWIADLFAYGMIRGSFVPPPAVQELRDLTRTRKQLVRERVQHTQRLQKVLEDANIKLTNALSDLLGESGRAILDALVAGETDPDKLASLANYRVKASRQALVDALRGRVTSHHRFLLKLHLKVIDDVDATLAVLDEEVGRQLEPFQDVVKLLATMPGVSERVAHVIVSEIGIDMQRFRTAGHLISWAGLCPQLNESAGKRKSTRLRKGAPWLKTVLVQSALSAIRVKGSYFQSQFHRVRARRGAKKALIAVAASMLTAAYFMISRCEVYRDLGATHFDTINEAKTTNRLVKRLADLGYAVELKKIAA